MSLRRLTVKLDDRILAEIESEAKAGRVGRSVIMRERLERSRSEIGSLWQHMHDLVIDTDAAPTALARGLERLRGGFPLSNRLLQLAARRPRNGL